ncbi:MAG: hypothetical protein HY234_08495 [Acidobacteria bacterium]|nr:hypothetical protein [Acidobacteriota bacterium]MBI3663070.1 hypothetical protein [Acidobacteriota bacterium]
MTNHLTDEQLNAVLVAEEDITATLHLAGCDECRRDLHRLRTVLADVCAESRALADRPQWFWREQRLAIVSRIPAGPDRATRPLAWAASLAVFVLAAALLTQSVKPVQPAVSRATGTVGVSMQSDPDHDLLVDVERSVRRDVPRALEPATLLAQELHRAADRKPNR